MTPQFGEPGFGIKDGSKPNRRAMEARGGKELENAWEQEDRLALQERLAKIAPAKITEPRCHVCTHPNREWIEYELVHGHSYSAIARSLPDDVKVDRRSIGSHYENHMSLDEAAIRAIMEQESSAIGQSHEEGVRGAITKRGVLEIALRKAFDDIIEGITTVEPKDLIQIVKLMNEMDSKSSNAAVEEARAQIALFQQAIINVLDETQLQLIGDEIGRLRAAEGITAQLESGLIPEAEVVDAEISSS